MEGNSKMIKLTPELRERATKVQKQIHSHMEWLGSIVNEKDTRKWYQLFYLPPPKQYSYSDVFAVALFAKIAELELKIEQINND